MQYYKLIFLSFLLLAVTIALCQENFNKKNKNMEIKPDNFTNVQINSPNEQPCSPNEPATFGISINIPSEITLSKNKHNSVFPLCGVYYFPLSTLEKHPEPLMICLRHIESDVFFSGAIQDNDPSPDEPEPEPDFFIEEAESETGDMNIISHFNPNILDHVNFSLLPGNYEIYVEYAKVESNIEIIKINLKN